MKTEVCGYFFSFHCDTNEIELGTANKQQNFFPYLAPFGITNWFFCYMEGLYCRFVKFWHPFPLRCWVRKIEMCSPELRLYPAKKGMNIL